jgi:hypothetical protein
MIDGIVIPQSDLGRVLTPGGSAGMPDPAFADSP